MSEPSPAPPSKRPARLPAGRTVVVRVFQVVGVLVCGLLGLGLLYMSIEPLRCAFVPGPGHVCNLLGTRHRSIAGISGLVLGGLFAIPGVMLVLFSVLRLLPKNWTYVCGGLTQLLCGVFVGRYTASLLPLMLLPAGCMVALGGYGVLVGLGLFPTPHGRLRTPVWQSVWLALALGNAGMGFLTVTQLDAQFNQYYFQQFTRPCGRHGTRCLAPSAEGIRAALGAYAADSSGHSFPGPIADDRMLRTLLSANGMSLRETALPPTWDYTPIDADADGIYDDYTLRIHYTVGAIHAGSLRIRPEGITVCLPPGKPAGVHDILARRALSRATRLIPRGCPPP